MVGELDDPHYIVLAQREIHRMQLAAGLLDQLGNVLASLGAALFLPILWSLPANTKLATARAAYHPPPRGCDTTVTAGLQSPR